MEKVKNLILPKSNPQQVLRDWQRRLRQECRNIDRQIRDIQREEKGVQKAIREAANRNDMGYAKCVIQRACDPKSLLVLYGVQLDYSDALMGAGFKFKNPNATKACSCGKSFAA